MKILQRIISSAVITVLLFTNFSFAEAKVVRQGNEEIKEMALTFDDGYSVEKIRAIAAKLNKYDVKGTFFFVGSFMASHKDIIPELEADGHMVVSHSYTHPDFTKLTDKGIVGEIENTKIAYTKATDKKMLPYFRPPYGAYNDRVLNVLGEKHDLYVVMWSIDTLDWKSLSASEISNTVLTEAGNGKIVLMHTTKHVNTDVALDTIIPQLQNKGYRLVRIDEMLSKLPEEQQIAGIEKNNSFANTSDSSAISSEPALTSEQPSQTSDTKQSDETKRENAEKKRKTYLYRLIAVRQKINV